MFGQDITDSPSPDAVAQSLILVMVQNQCLPQVQAYRTYHVFLSSYLSSIWQSAEAVIWEPAIVRGNIC